MRTKYALTVEFRDQAGVEQRARTGYREAYGRYRRGEKVDIRYNPGRPSEFAIDSFRSAARLSGADCPVLPGGSRAPGSTGVAPPRSTAP